MRCSLLAATALLALAPIAALADENFIPMGQDYGIGQNPTPPLDSEQSKFNAQVDIYQSEVYNRNLNQKEFDSRLYNLETEQNPDDPSDNQLDY